MLNKNKPYGEVCGPGVAYKYEQNGRYFDHQELEVTVKGEQLEEPEKPSKPVREFLKESSDITLDDLTVKEMREQLDKLGVKHKHLLLKPDILALLREEIIARDNE